MMSVFIHANGVHVDSSGNAEMGRRLLDGGALTHVAVDMRAYSGSRTPFSIASMTPLHCASLKGHLPFVKLLLQHNADVNMVTPVPVRTCMVDLISAGEDMHGGSTMDDDRSSMGPPWGSGTLDTYRAP